MKPSDHLQHVITCVADMMESVHRRLKEEHQKETATADALLDAARRSVYRVDKIQLMGDAAVHISKANAINTSIHILNEESGKLLKKVRQDG